MMPFKWDYGWISGREQYEITEYQPNVAIDADVYKRQLHLPGPRVIAVSAAGERAHRTDVDALAALVALEVIFFVGRNQRNRAAVDNAERAYAHAFIADADATETQDAARGIEENYRRPLLLFRVIFDFGVAAFALSLIHI